VAIIFPELLVELISLLPFEVFLDADPPSDIKEGPCDSSEEKLRDEGEWLFMLRCILEVCGHLRTLKVAWRVARAKVAPMKKESYMLIKLIKLISNKIQKKKELMS